MGMIQCEECGQEIVDPTNWQTMCDNCDPEYPNAEYHREPEINRDR